MQRVQFRLNDDLYAAIEKAAGADISVDLYIKRYVEKNLCKDDFMVKSQQYLIDQIAKISLMNQSILQETMRIDDDQFANLMGEIVSASDDFLIEKGLKEDE